MSIPRVFKKIIFVSFSLVMMVSVSEAKRKSNTAVVKGEPTYKEVPYGKDERQVLNFWQAEGKGPRPVMIVIHPGGWMGRKMDATSSGFGVYLRKGISVAAINYRLTPDNPLPAPVHDAARAVQFVRYKAKEWNVDKEHIALKGDSAGGCSSAWILLHDDLKDPKSPDPVLRESTRVSGALIGIAQTCIDPKVLKEWMGEIGIQHPMISNAVGQKRINDVMKHYKKYEKTYVEFSPINHVDKDDPPLFLNFKGDLTLPMDNTGQAIHHPIFAQKMLEASQKVGHKCYWPNGDKKSKYKSQFIFIFDVLGIK